MNSLTGDCDLDFSFSFSYLWTVSDVLSSRGILPKYETAHTATSRLF